MAPSFLDVCGGALLPPRTPCTPATSGQSLPSALSVLFSLPEKSSPRLRPRTADVPGHSSKPTQMSSSLSSLCRLSSLPFHAPPAPRVYVSVITCILLWQWCPCLPASLRHWLCPLSVYPMPRPVTETQALPKRSWLGVVGGIIRSLSSGFCDSASGNRSPVYFSRCSSADRWTREQLTNE